MNFDIVTDSACNLPEGIIDEFNLHVLPLTFMVDGQQYQSYLKGAHTDLKQFYDMMRDGKVITTSLPNMSESEKLLRSLLEDDLMFLFRGGRVSKTSAWAGTLLNIKPVLHVDDEGHLIPMEKVRGRRKSLNALLEHMDESADRPVEEQTVMITHGDCADDAQYVADMIKKHYGVENVIINYVDPVIGAHSGPGTMALFFLADKR